MKNEESSAPPALRAGQREKERIVVPEEERKFVVTRAVIANQGNQGKIGETGDRKGRADLPADTPAWEAEVEAPASMQLALCDGSRTAAAQCIPVPARSAFRPGSGSSRTGAFRPLFPAHPEGASAQHSWRARPLPGPPPAPPLEGSAEGKGFRRSDR